MKCSMSHCITVKEEQFSIDCAIDGNQSKSQTMQKDISIRKDNSVQSKRQPVDTVVSVMDSYSVQSIVSGADENEYLCKLKKQLSKYSLNINCTNCNSESELSSPSSTSSTSSSSTPVSNESDGQSIYAQSEWSISMSFLNPISQIAPTRPSHHQHH